MADYQKNLSEFEQRKVSIYALSSDSPENAKGTAEKLGVTFPVLHSMDGPATSELLGGYYEEKRNLIQPINFILFPNQSILSITTSSGPAGRLEAIDAIRMVDFQLARMAKKSS